MSPDALDISDSLEEGEEGIVYGDIDLYECMKSKMICDVYGNSMKANCLKFSLNVNSELPCIVIGEQPDNAMTYEQICSI